MKTKFIKPNINQTTKLIEWMYESVLSEGGDGDAFWYSKLFDIKDLKEIVEEYDRNHAIGWDVEYDEYRELFTWSKGEEGIVITNSEIEFLKKPDWVIITLIY